MGSMSKFITTLSKFLSSKRLAAYLIGILTVVTTVGVLIPQQPADVLAVANSWYSQGIVLKLISLLDLNNLFFSWWFLVLSGLFLMNLLICTYKQTMTALRLWRYFDVNQTNVESSADFRFQHKTIDQSTITQIAKDNSLQVQDETANISLVKHRWGLFSSVLFHAGLIIIVVGGLLTLSSKMSGYATIGVGETRTEEHGLYHYLTEGALFKLVDNHTNYDIKLVKQDRIYQNNDLDYVKSHVEVYKNQQLIKAGVVEKGHPLIIGDLRIFHYSTGFAPGLIVKDTQGGIKHAGYVLVEVLKEDKGDRHTLEKFVVPNTSLEISMELFPNYTDVGGRAGSVGDKPLNPRFMVEVRDKGQILYKDLMKLDQTIVVGGNSITLTQLSNWSGFEIVRDMGASILFLGSWISLVGMIMLFLGNPCKVNLRLRETDSLYEITSVYVKNKKSMNQEFVDTLLHNR